ncbi:membrane-bound alkaline phosphatase-like isoform X2 [Galleria mellonella]|uniref:Alkaline phosphatase n=1 Tax=Galleria mellonella TaxID=7137 RepID=A0A6J1X1N2_GALME|nr:membrane-bound alkaline phosphatase-like isoform X2 [Galleria mellonella]
MRLPPLVLITLVSCWASVSSRRHPDPPPLSARAAAAINPAERTAQYWVEEAQAGIRARVKHDKSDGVARNVVMFLGDGMSVPTLAAARTLLGQNRGRTGEESQLSFEEFPTVGLAKTYCVNHQIADSACTATAYLCGVKNNYGMIGLTAAVPRRDCVASLDNSTHVASIAEWALQDGRDVGIVTTTRITHASPAGAYAKIANRNWENDLEVLLDGQDPLLCRDIAHQLVHSYPGNQFKVILGGGRREFLPNTTFDEEGTQGLRTDGLNLIEEWQASKESQNVDFKYVWNREQLMNLSQSPPDYLLGLFEGDHMQYHLEANNVTEPSLTELTEIAIRSLSRNEKGFFLFVESGRIDHGHHDNYAHLALDETIQLHAAVQRATEMLSEEDSLIVVTSDHSHVMAINGYSPRGNSIIGRSNEVGDDGIPYMTVSYTNGPGARPHDNGARVDVTTEENFGSLRWRTHAEVPLEDETHGGDDVAVFARGPHHALFTGLYEQSRIPHLMAYAACIGPGLHYCNAATHASYSSIFLIVTLLYMLNALNLHR